jgi:hypothetical protein
MKRWFTLGLIVTVFSGLAVACGDDDDGEGGGDKCAEAEKILKDCDSEFETECTAAAAECVIKYPDAACSEELTADVTDYIACLGAAQ